MIEIRNHSNDDEKMDLQNKNNNQVDMLKTDHETKNANWKTSQSKDCVKGEYTIKEESPDSNGKNKTSAMDSIDCDNNVEVQTKLEKCETEHLENSSIDKDNYKDDEDEDFAEFVRKTVKSRAHVKKLVDYDTNTDESSDSPVTQRGHKQYRKRKPDTDSDEDNTSGDHKISEHASSAQTDGTPMLLKHSQLNENSTPDNVDISDLSSDSSDESELSPKQRRDSSSASESNDDPIDVSTLGPPKHKWRALFDLRQREFGYSNLDDAGYFRKQVQGSLQMVQRFKLQYKMEKHEGCVNALHFNKIGKL
jgi:hypothetical protein